MLIVTYIIPGQTNTLWRGYLGFKNAPSLLPNESKSMDTPVTQANSRKEERKEFQSFVKASKNCPKEVKKNEERRSHIAVYLLIGALAVPAMAQGDEGCSLGFWKNHTDA